MLTIEEKQEQLMAKLQAGGVITSVDEMTDEYKENLINLMIMQADSELSGAFGYVPWIMKAPTIDEKLVVSNIVKDEVRHAVAIYRLLNDLGVDTEERVRQLDLTLRIADGQDIGASRIASDARVNIFYFPIETWSDFILFNFCMDRGAGHQLEDAKHCSYQPWAREMERIFREEMMHVSHGDMWVKRLATNPETRDDLQERLNKWYVRTMNIFGRPGSKRNAIYRKYNLKQRDNHEVRMAFHAEVKGICDELSLTLPAWDLSMATTEDAMIPG